MRIRNGQMWGIQIRITATMVKMKNFHVQGTRTYVIYGKDNLPINLCIWRFSSKHGIKSIFSSLETFCCNSLSFIVVVHSFVAVVQSFVVVVQRCLPPS
jgi:hypothetical protein